MYLVLSAADYVLHIIQYNMLTIAIAFQIRGAALTLSHNDPNSFLGFSQHQQVTQVSTRQLSCIFT